MLYQDENLHICHLIRTHYLFAISTRTRTQTCLWHVPTYLHTYLLYLRASYRTCTDGNIPSYLPSIHPSIPGAARSGKLFNLRPVSPEQLQQQQLLYQPVKQSAESSLWAIALPWNSSVK